MKRVLVAVSLMLLLVGLQEQLVVHEVHHLRAKVQRGPDASLQTRGSGECAECLLLAAGINAAPLAEATIAFETRLSTAVASSSASAPTFGSPSFYLSTGPPAVL